MLLRQEAKPKIVITEFESSTVGSDMGMDATRHLPTRESELIEVVYASGITLKDPTSPIIKVQDRSLLHPE